MFRQTSGGGGWQARGWAAIALLALAGLGGAARGLDGLFWGAPPVTAALLALGVLAVLAWAAGAAAARACTGLLVVFALVWGGWRLRGVAALSGPPLLALALAGVVVAARRVDVRLAGRVFLPFVAALYCGVAARVQSQVGPEGDEPHYLMVADSLLRDGDLALERDYAEGRYRAFHPQDLEPHYRVRGRGGAIYSLHAVGLSLLVLPAYAVGGYPAASFFMALLAALLAREIRELLRAALGESPAVEGAAWLVALSPPLVSYAGLVFTEIPAALVVAFALRRALAPAEGRWSRPLAAGAALAALPWLNVRYTAAAGLLVALGLWTGRRPRAAAALLAAPLASALALAAYHHALYGFYDPRRVYGARPELALRQLPEGLQGLLLDQEFGLLIYAPVLVLALPGLAALARPRRALAATAAALIVAVLLIAGSWPMWRGGWNPPARFLVPVLPALALGLAARLRAGVTAGVALLAGWSLWVGLTGAWQPRLVHRDRDATAPLFRAAAGGQEWTTLLPAYVLSEPDRHRLAAVWAAALLLAAASRRPVSARGLALAVTALAGFAAIAGRITDGDSGGRDAVRLVGRPACGIPVGGCTGSARGRWAAAAGDGALYEPHRHADGLEVGLRLPLEAGSYRLEISGDDLAAAAAPPRLRLELEGVPARRLEVACVRAPGGLRAEFDLPGGATAVTLRLRGGGPFLIRSLALAAQPSAPPPV